MRAFSDVPRERAPLPGAEPGSCISAAITVIFIVMYTQTVRTMAAAVCLTSNTTRREGICFGGGARKCIVAQTGCGLWADLVAHGASSYAEGRCHVPGVPPHPTGYKVEALVLVERVHQVREAPRLVVALQAQERDVGDHEGVQTSTTSSRNRGKTWRFRATSGENGAKRGPAHLRG